MDVIELDESNAVYAFHRSEAKRGQGSWMIAGGIGLLLLSFVGFGFALMNPVGQIAVHLLSTMPTIMAVFLLTAGWSVLSAPKRVIIDGEALEIEKSKDSVRHHWNDVGWATVTTAGMSHKRVLVVYDRDGKKIASLSESFRDFDDMIELVKSRVADGPESKSEEIRAKKSRRAGLFTGGVGAVMLCVSAGIAWMTHEGQRTQQLLETNAVEGTGTIDELLVAPNGYTTRVRYTVTNEAGISGSRNAEITPDYHAELTDAEAKTIPVEFVPDEPAISRLMEGEVIENDFLNTPAGGYGLAGAGGLLSIFLLIVGVMQWKGWDIDLDSKTGKLSITRFGEGA